MFLGLGSSLSTSYIPKEEILGPLMSGGAAFPVHIFLSSLVEVRCCVTLRSDIYLPPGSYSFGV